MAETPWVRNCPICGEEIVYARQTSYCTANTKRTRCKKCVNASRKGEGNSFYGRKHTEETKAKLRTSSREYTQTDAFKAAVSRGMEGKPYGGGVQSWANLPPEEAARRRAQWLAKLSVASAGSNNPMFGKPAPTGSGNGWSGWYKGWYFRSILELSYVVLVLEREGRDWRPAESADMAIPYTDPLGQERTYYADFIVDGSILVECKPESLLDTPLVQAKRIGAEKYCRDKGWTYQLITPPRLSEEAIRDLHDEGTVVWLERYRRKFEERVGQH